ncbi:hypothetical protein GGP77_003121 [Salinibacter ruber]|uniref:hypothetical protein n=1 Tax=Salinibacter ruber TaxID=146919 RepID=UPI002169F08A|nr:hypothetical protein [Salinibacter ruber]MCS3668867.1 hypothetical protein [Salinibacter ruber]
MAEHESLSKAIDIREICPSDAAIVQAERVAGVAEAGSVADTAVFGYLFILVFGRHPMAVHHAQVGKPIQSGLLGSGDNDVGTAVFGPPQVEGTTGTIRSRDEPRKRLVAFQNRETLVRTAIQVQV